MWFCDLYRKEVCTLLNYWPVLMVEAVFMLLRFELFSHLILGTTVSFSCFACFSLILWDIDITLLSWIWSTRLLFYTFSCSFWMLSFPHSPIEACDSGFFPSFFELLFNDLQTMMQFVYMNLHVHVEESIIELVDIDNFSSLVGGHVNAPSFKMKGKYLGITTLYVSLQSISINLTFIWIQFLNRLLKTQKLSHYLLEPGQHYATFWTCSTNSNYYGGSLQSPKNTPSWTFSATWCVICGMFQSTNAVSSVLVWFEGVNFERNTYTNITLSSLIYVLFFC